MIDIPIFSRYICTFRAHWSSASLAGLKGCFRFWWVFVFKNGIQILIACRVTLSSVSQRASSNFLNWSRVFVLKQLTIFRSVKSSRIIILVDFVSCPASCFCSWLLSFHCHSIRNRRSSQHHNIICCSCYSINIQYTFEYLGVSL